MDDVILFDAVVIGVLSISFVSMAIDRYEMVELCSVISFNNARCASVEVSFYSNIH